MKIAFCLFKYFPYGGLQRDFIRIAEKCHERGHEIFVYTMEWQGDLHNDFEIELIPIKAKQNHTRSVAYVKTLQQIFSKKHHDVIVGFNKMPMLDVYYAADLCFQAKPKNLWQRMLPRYKTWKALEEAVFARGRLTEILLIAAQEQQKFSHFYKTEPHRFHYLPPGIHRERFTLENEDELRKQVRESLGLAPDSKLIVMVGSGFKAKGVDRALHGVASLPQALKSKTILAIAGQDNAKRFKRLAKDLNISDKVIFLGPRNDIPALLAAANLLIHPAYRENTGTVLLEAMVVGLPVLTTDVCGYANYIANADTGIVLPSPYRQEDLNAALEHMLTQDTNAWRENAKRYTKEHDLYSLVEKAVDIIECVGKNRANLFR